MLNFKKVFFETSFIPSKIKRNVIALEIAKENWEKIIGKKFISKIRPYDFRDGILFIEVPDHYYSQMLSSYSVEILERLENKVPSKLKPLFCEIRFKINPSLNKNYSLTKNKSRNHEEVEKIIQNICNSIDDPELKDLFKRVVKSYFTIK